MNRWFPDSRSGEYVTFWYLMVNSLFDYIQWWIQSYDEWWYFVPIACKRWSETNVEFDMIYRLADNFSMLITMIIDYIILSKVFTLGFGQSGEKYVLEQSEMPIVYHEWSSVRYCRVDSQDIHSEKKNIRQAMKQSLKKYTYS